MPVLLSWEEHTISLLDRVVASLRCVFKAWQAENILSLSLHLEEGSQMQLPLKIPNNNIEKVLNVLYVAFIWKVGKLLVENIASSVFLIFKDP